MYTEIIGIDDKKDEDAKIRLAATDAMVKLGDSKVIEFMIKRLELPNIRSQPWKLDGNFKTRFQL
ncbi:MAG: hypothetical protein ACXAC5_15205 [Promethearchaeota archaeon]